MAATTTPHINSVFTEYTDRIKSMYVPGTYRTWRSYTTDLHRYLAHRQNIETVGELSGPVLDDYLVWVADRHPGSTASSKFTFVTNFARYLNRREYTDTILTEDYKLDDYNIEKGESMRVSNEEGVVKPYLKPDKVRLLWQHAPEPRRFRNETLIKYMWLTGLRRHEVSFSRLEEVKPAPGGDCYQAKVYSRKTKKKDGDGRGTATFETKEGEETFTTWTVYFDKSFGTQLKTWKEVFRPQYNGADESPYLFLTNKSKRMSGNLINEVVKRAAKNAGIQEVIGTDALGREHNHVVAHTLRHSFGTHLANNPRSDVSLSQLMYHMGHNSYSTTELYVHDDQEVRMETFAKGSTAI